MSKYLSSETTQNKIIDAAGRLAAEHGLSNVSTRAVAQMSGENIGSIHYHFGGKDGLLESVVCAAINYCKENAYYSAIASLSEDSTPEELSQVVRTIVNSEVTDLFRLDRPVWHAQVIYQLLQHDDELSQLFRTEMLEPSMEALGRFFRLAKPGIGPEETFQRIVILKMPIFGHANYMTIFLSRLEASAYSEDYLQGFEDLLVRQTQLSLGLPVDEDQED